MNCGDKVSNLADLLLDPHSVPVDSRRHVEQCAECGEALAELQATMALMDEWQVPEAPSYFDSKLMARLRSEQSAPAGFFEKVKARFLYGSSLRLQPMMAGALALVVLVGGGAYADLAWQASQLRESATVRDLQSFDGNEQVFQQLDSVDQSSTQQVNDVPSSND